MINTGFTRWLVLYQKTTGKMKYNIQNKKENENE